MPPSLLEETLEGWRDARESVIEEVRNIPAEHFDYRPTPDVRSVRDQVVHILEVAMMMVGELTQDELATRGDSTGVVEARAFLPSGAKADRPGATGEAEVLVARSNVLGALWWGIRKRIRGDLLL